MSRYRGPCFKKIQQLGALLELTSKRHKLKAILETNHIPVKISILYSFRRKIETVFSLWFYGTAIT